MKKTPSKPAAAFRMTPQRAELLRVLEGNKSHPSAEQLHRRLKKKFPGVSFATVYNTLQSLLAIGELAEVRIDRTRSRFDPCTDGHAHLLCVHCGAIADLPLAGPPAAAGAPRGFRVLRCNVEFYGVCPACDKKAGAKEKTLCQKKRRK
ncbi:MAG: Fur family transcriptional regulator [Elusimicrobiales bacterium]